MQTAVVSRILPKTHMQRKPMTADVHHYICYKVHTSACTVHNSAITAVMGQVATLPKIVACCHLLDHVRQYSTEHGAQICFVKQGP